ncbi:MAG: hypothetical protein BroJett011_43000 [Chloroflexota bacterium]|nr:MAG: hypothetical protein BroJett011_43000 [Chloroflexota bacterium]
MAALCPEGNPVKEVGKNLRPGFAGDAIPQPDGAHKRGAFLPDNAGPNIQMRVLEEKFQLPFVDIQALTDKD